MGSAWSPRALPRADFLQLCRFGRSAISSPMVLSWRQRILDCIGLPASNIAPTQPVHVVLVNRPYYAGRAFLNAPDAVATMQVSRW